MDMTLLTGVGVQKAETSDKPLVSVVVAAYNASVLLKRALISLQTQSLDASLYEVIVIDDGSVDNTPHVLRDFCESAPNFRWYSQSNQGPARARNVGIRRTCMVVIIKVLCIPFWWDCASFVLFRNFAPTWSIFYKHRSYILNLCLQCSGSAFIFWHYCLATLQNTSRLSYSL